MPKRGVALFVRPDWDPAMMTSYYYVGLAMDYATRRMTVTDIAGDETTKANILGALETVDPAFVYLSGHGTADSYQVIDYERVMETCQEEVESLIGRVVLFKCCYAGISLAPDAVSKGAVAAFANTELFSWWEGEEDGFFFSVNAISDALVNGLTTSEAMDHSLATWNEWIDYWLTSEDPWGPAIAALMIEDRDGQVFFGDPTATVANPGKGYHRVKRQVATLFDGRTVAKGIAIYKCPSAMVYVTVTIPNLNFIEEILNIQIHTKPETGCPTLGNKSINENVVGITICGVADGVTVTVEAIAIGV